MQIQGLLTRQFGVLFDNIQIRRFEWPLIIFPKNHLGTLENEPASGQWKLEILDDRAGPGTGPTNLLSWQLQFYLTTNYPPATALTGGIASTNNTIQPGQFAYFVVDVPLWATAATNILFNATGPLNVWFNQNGIPTGSPADTLLFGPTAAGSYTLTTGGTPPLLPGQRYYLGVENPGATPVTFDFEVDFDITALANGVPVTGTNAPSTALPRYFQYDVSTNASAVLFTLSNLTGNADLVVRHGLPLPTLTSYDYASFSPGTNDEAITLFTNSVVLTPGTWYLGVFDQDVTPVTYTIEAQELTNVFPNIITLTNGVPYFNTNPGGANTNDYYLYVVSTNAARVQFEINNPSADVALVAHKNLPLPDINNASTYDYLSTNAYPNDQLILIYPNSTPVPLTPGDWFLTAVNLSGGPANYSIMATEWPTTGTNLNLRGYLNGGSFCLEWDSLIGAHYVVQGKVNLSDPAWTDVSPTITATDVTTTYCIPLPSTNNFFQVVEGEAVLPPPAPTTIQLTNAVPYLNTNAGGTSSNDYYLYVVSTNAARVQFEINNASATMALAARYGLPLPDLTTYDYLSTNPYPNDQLIMVYPNSSPVPLQSGDWYLTAVNLSGGAASYSIMATEWLTTGTNLNVQGYLSAGDFCLTWNSLAGVHYVVQGKTSLSDPLWTDVSPTITATNATTSYCIPLPSSFNYFNVVEGLALVPPNISSIVFNGTGFVLQWTASPSQQFQVQWKTGLAASTWSTFTNIITSTNGQFSFTDDGTQSGGLGGTKFYRLINYP